MTGAFDAKSARTRQPMPLWAGAFDRATKEQGPEIIGAYMLILMAMWEAKSCDLPDDEKHLAWVAKVSPTIWRRKYAPVIMPMLSKKNSRIFSEKLQENAEKTEEYCRKQYARKAGNIEPKPLKTNKRQSTADDTAEQTAVDPPDQPKPLTINHIKEVGGVVAREAESDLILQIMHTLGFDRGQAIPKYWVAPDAPLIVNRWKADLGLGDDEILQVAKANSAQHGQPANGPKTLNRAMADYAAAKLAPPMQPSIVPPSRASPQPQTFTPADLAEMVRKREEELEARRGAQ